MSLLLNHHKSNIVPNVNNKPKTKVKSKSLVDLFYFKPRRLLLFIHIFIHLFICHLQLCN